MPSSYISRTRTTVRLMCICVHYVLQSLYAPVGMALEPVVMGAQALMFPGWGLAAKYVAAHTRETPRSWRSSTRSRRS